MIDKPDRICPFRRLLALLAVFIGMALSSSPALASASRDSTATFQESEIAPTGYLQEYVQGLLLDMKGDYWGAIDTFKSVMARRPDDAAVRYSISQSWFRLAVLDSARVYGEAAVKLDPSNRYYLRYLAGVAHDMRDYDRAAELYGQELELEPERTDIMYLQGLEYFAAKQPEKALEAFRKAVQVDPYNEAALVQILTLEVGLKHYPAAIETSKQLLKLGGNERKVGITLAGLYAKTGQDALAVQTLRELIAEDRDNLSSWVALFDHYIKGGRLADYRHELVSFLDTVPSTPESLRGLAKLYILRSGRDSLYAKPATVMLDELIARRPRDSELFTLKGMYGMMHGRREEGAASLSKAVQLDSGNVTAWEYLITSRFDLGNKRKAFSLLEKARLRLPGERLRWSAIEGYLLLYSHQPKRAVAVLERVVRSKGRQHDQSLLIQVNNNLATAYDLLGMKKLSREAYERVLDLDPHNTLAMNNLAYLFAEEGIRLQQALRLATNAVLLEPENGVYLDTLGWVHYKLGNFDLARQILQKAVTSGLDDEPEVYRHLAEVYRKLGNEPKAKEMLEKAKSVKKAQGNKKSGH